MPDMTHASPLVDHRNGDSVDGDARLRHIGPARRRALSLSVMSLRMRSSVVMLALAACSSATAASLCQWDVSLRDGNSREVRVFQPGSQPFDLPLSNLKGFKTCRVSAVKDYEVKGVKASRVDFWCFTTSGDAVNVGSVASTRFGSDVTTFQLLSGPVSFVSKGTETEVNTAGYVEITASCK